MLHGVSLLIESGETFALVGRSGSGKTTLLRLVNRLVDPDRGQVMVDGREVRAWDPIELRRRTGYVIQDVGLFPHLTVAANIATVPTLLRWAPDRIASRIDHLLTLVGLEPRDYRGRWPDQLSGGERQRVGLARALAADPPLLLMDEPFGALDPITRSELHAEFKRVRDSRGDEPSSPSISKHRSIIIVTHDMAEAFALADRIAVLHDGRVIACAPGPELERSTDQRVTALLAAR